MRIYLIFTICLHLLAILILLVQTFSFTKIRRKPLKHSKLLPTPMKTKINHSLWLPSKTQTTRVWSIQTNYNFWWVLNPSKVTMQQKLWGETLLNFHIRLFPQLIIKLASILCVSVKKCVKVSMMEAHDYYFMKCFYKRTTTTIADKRILYKWDRKSGRKEWLS